MVKPIRPADVTKSRHLGKNIPPKVVGIVNKMISEKWDGTVAKIMQGELADRVASGLNVDREEVFAKGWLDFEPLFESVGWRVRYDKPGYNESYEASFEFTKKRSRG